MSQEQKKRLINNLIRVAVILLLAFLIGRFTQRSDTRPDTGQQPAQTEAQSASNDTQSGSQDQNTQTAGGTSLSSDDGGEDREEIFTFRNRYLRKEHFKKHGNEFSYKTEEEYERGASAVVNNSDALHKKEAEDGDDVYYVEKTNEFVVVSTDGYIRTYFRPRDGLKYFNRQ